MKYISVIFIIKIHQNNIGEKTKQNIKTNKTYKPTKHKNPGHTVELQKDYNRQAGRTSKNFQHQNYHKNIKIHQGMPRVVTADLLEWINSLGMELNPS